MIRSRSRTILLLSCIAVISLASCIAIAGRGTPDIIVVDDTGQPVPHATVTGVSLSIQGQHTTTNERGYASIPWAAQPTEGIEVEKAGYLKSEQISVRQTKPIEVVLKKVPAGVTPEGK
jgi:hypothetical protein